MCDGGKKQFVVGTKNLAKFAATKKLGSFLPSSSHHCHPIPTTAHRNIENVLKAPLVVNVLE